MVKSEKDHQEHSWCADWSNRTGLWPWGKEEQTETEVQDAGVLDVVVAPCALGECRDHMAGRMGSFTTIGAMERSEVVVCGCLC